MIPGMMGSEKKGIAAMLVAKDGPEGMEDPSAEKDNDIGLSAAADEILSAVESKDSGALKSALKSFMEMCESEKESPVEDASESAE